MQGRAGAGEGAPGSFLPGLATAHRTAREDAEDHHSVAALGTVELALDAVSGGPELDVAGARRVDRDLRFLRHVDPLENTRPDRDFLIRSAHTALRANSRARSASRSGASPAAAAAHRRLRHSVPWPLLGPRR